MKKKIGSFFTMIVMVGVLICFSQVPAVFGAVTLEVLNPRGEIKALPNLVPTQRITELEGKKIGIYWIGKQGGNNFWDVIEEQLRAKFPKAQIIRYNGPFDLGADMAKRIAKEVDTFIYGVGD